MKKVLGPQVGSKIRFFCYFLKVVSLVSIDIAQDCSLGQCLTSSRAETSCLLLWLKFRSARGASRHPAFMGNCHTISHTPHTLLRGWRKRGVNSVHCLGSVQEFGIWKIEIRDKKYVTLLQGSVMSVGWHVISFMLGLCSCRMAAVAPSPWPSGQRNKTQPQKPQFELQEDRTRTRQFF